MQTTTLDGKNGEKFDLTCNMLEPDVAYKLVAKLGKLLLPLVVARAQQKLKADAMPVIDQIFAGLTPELAEQVRLELLSTMSVVRTNAEGQQQKYDLCNGRVAINNAFRGHTLMMFRAMKFAAEVNFRDFFDESGLASLMAQTPSA